MSKFKSLKKSTRTNIGAFGLVIIMYLVTMPLQATGIISNSIEGQLVPICTYIVMAISLNLTVGFLGELSLGHAGFMSVGAFSGVIAAVSFQDSIQSQPLLLLVSIIIGGLLAGVAGLIIGIPVLRLRGDYLAIVTLAFGEIIKNIINCLYIGVDVNGLHFSMQGVDGLGMENGKIIVNGPQGAVGIPKMATLTAGFLLIIFTLFVALNLINSKNGRAVTAIRDNRIAAESVGIGVTKYKLTTFIVSAVLAGMAGALYAMNFSTVAAKKFDFNTSILIIVFVVLGGMGNIIGSIIATTVLYMLPELLREFSDYRMLLYAIVLIVVMIATNSEKAIQLRESITNKIFKKRKTKGKEVTDNE